MTNDSSEGFVQASIEADQNAREQSERARTAMTELYTASSGRDKEIADHIQHKLAYLFSEQAKVRPDALNDRSYFHAANEVHQDLEQYVERGSPEEVAAAKQLIEIIDEKFSRFTIRELPQGRGGNRGK